MRDLANLVITMVVIAALSALALAQINEMTKGPIAENKKRELVAALKDVLPPFDNDPSAEIKEVVTGKDKKGKDVKTVFYLAKQGDQLTGTAFRSLNREGYAGDIWVLVGVDATGTISGIKIVDHKETPGLGDKYTKQSWYDLFKGKNLDNARIAVKKDGGDIDYVTGATITARAAATAVKDGLESFRKEFGNVQTDR
ncbi:MAG: RnfABCDGE type electron transport complex subunit G [Nitrospirota bacterium]|nr:RnfABCDGE type electron transport complex subunit G [Nitrospirota bacterium]